MRAPYPPRRGLLGAESPPAVGDDRASPCRESNPFEPELQRKPHGLQDRSFLFQVERSEGATEAASLLQGGYRFWRPKVFLRTRRFFFRILRYAPSGADNGRNLRGKSKSEFHRFFFLHLGLELGTPVPLSPGHFLRGRDPRSGE